MAKETKKGAEGFKFFKLGTTASVFYDPFSKLKVVNNVPGKVLASRVGTNNKKVTAAQAKGHIILISEDEYNEMMGEVETSKAEAEADDEVNIDIMTSEEMDEYVENNGLLEGDDLEEFKALSKKAKKAKLKELIA